MTALESIRTPASGGAPHNIDAEESVLGAVMLSADAANAALEVLKPDDDSIHFQLGQVYRRLGRKEEAEKEFARAQGLQAAEREMLERKVLGELPPSPVQPSNGPPDAH